MDVMEKLVELLGRCPCESDCEGMVGSCPNRKHGYCNEIFKLSYCSVSKLAQHLIAHGVTVQEWIPASEPPKKITNKVIVLCKNGYIGYGHYEDYKGKQTWYNLESGKPFTDWDLEDCESYEVTHWMQITQPQKGE